MMNESHTKRTNDKGDYFTSQEGMTNYFNEVIEKVSKNEIVLPGVDLEKATVIKEWTANTVKYERRKLATFSRWLRTIAEYGGDELGKLGSHEDTDRFGDKKPCLILYLRGPREEHKYRILDRLLQFIILHWKKSNGDPYEPCSYNTFLKHISAILKGEGVEYNIGTEFKGKGEFHAVFRNCLEEYRLNNKDYGGKKQEAFMDPKADAKVQRALLEGDLRPYHVFSDMIKVVLFCLARFFCLRGGEELCKALVDHFRFSTYMFGPDRGLGKIEYVNEEYKARYLKMNRIYLSSKGYPEVREEKVDPILHPYRFIKDFFDLQRPPAVNQRFFLKATSDTKELSDRQVNAGNRFHLTRSVIGEGKIRQYWKELVCTCKFVNPEKNKPHGGRSLATTTMVSQNLAPCLITKQTRHNSEQTIKEYNRLHPVSSSLIQNAIGPKSIEGAHLSPQHFEQSPQVVKDRPSLVIPLPSLPSFFRFQRTQPSAKKEAVVEKAVDAVIPTSLPCRPNPVPPEGSAIEMMLCQQQQMQQQMLKMMREERKQRKKSTCALM